VLQHERIELRPAGFTHREELEFLSDGRKGRGVAGAGRAVEIEEPTNINVSRLAGIEPVKDFRFDARKKMRSVIA
jgi:hypothetical protein